MIISAPIFEAFLKCPSKCWFLFLGENGDSNIYSDFLRNKNNAYREAGLERLMAKIQPSECIVRPSVSVHMKAATWLLAVDFVATKENLESSLHAVERVPSKGQGKSVQVVPIRSIFANEITKNDKLVLAFDALVLSEMLRIEVSRAKIIYGNRLTTLKVRTSDLLDQVRKLTGKIVKLLASESPPDIILNRHCVECEYQAQCRQKAIEKDDLSLLSGMNEKECKKLNSKGIFTVTQLSYTFRPRRKNKRFKARQLMHYPALQALTVREKRVYILQRPDVPHARTLVFVDMEGDSGGSSIYLIGVLVVENGKQTPFVFWADTHTAEKNIFAQFSELLSRLDDVHIFYYGSYESRVFKRMLSLGSIDRLRDIFLNRSTNVLSMIYSRIYFPTYSNRLKEIGQYVGSTWSNPASSGLQSIVWRTQWEVSHDEGLKNSLIRYNMEDCSALKTITEFIDALPIPGHPDPDSSPKVGFADDEERDESLNRYEWGNRASAFEEYGNIVKYAYFDYQRSKVCIRTDDRLRKIVAQVERSKRKPLYRINARVELKLLKCHYCKSNNVCRDPTNHHVRDVFDLRFFSGGIKRWVTRYTAPIHTCLDCGMKPVPLRYRTQKMFGHGLMAWAMQQHVSNRISYEDIAKTINDSFGIPVGAPRIYKFKQALARYYESAYRKLLQKIMDGRVLHADETTIKLQRNNGYVWVFASPEEVVYIYKANRKADFLHDMLKDFKGILITDFYTGYDSLPCLQQKCLIHLIRDMNECLLKTPFDQELEGIARRFGGLMQKIVDTIDKRGLKTSYLRKYKNDVREHFNELSARTFISETAEKLRQRMLKYQSKLFLFLDYDGVPWNNNYGEHAIKPFARYRRVITGQINERGLSDYLLLLSLYATCEYRGIRFLDFLLSKELYLDNFSYRNK